MVYPEIPENFDAWAKKAQYLWDEVWNLPGAEIPY
jgi:hypothetical protein